MYVDLERDIIVTSHRRYWRQRRPDGGCQADESSEGVFGLWPVTGCEFKVKTLRMVVLQEVCSRIKIFAAIFRWSLNEIFHRRCGKGRAARRQVLVVMDAFVEREREEAGSYGRWVGMGRILLIGYLACRGWGPRGCG